MIWIGCFPKKLGKARKAYRKDASSHIKEKELVHYVREFDLEQQIIYSFQSTRQGTEWKWRWVAAFKWNSKHIMPKEDDKPFFHTDTMCLGYGGVTQHGETSTGQYNSRPQGQGGKELRSGAGYGTKMCTLLRRPLPRRTNHAPLSGWRQTRNHPSGGPATTGGHRDMSKALAQRLTRELLNTMEGNASMDNYFTNGQSQELPPPRPQEISKHGYQGQGDITDPD